ncbi:MAG: MBL fold metallo-hydrolase [Oligosphaeraceae bacterium]
MLAILFLVPAALVLAGWGILHSPSFGRLPSGKRLERIRQSPHYREGAFRYPVETEVMTSSRNSLAAMWEFLTQPRRETRPGTPVPAEKTDLHAWSRREDGIVWFGHSSYLLQIEGRRLLVDPVFAKAAPFRWMNRPYPGTDLWKPSDLPPCDWLLVTHDHWDHLDCQTVKELQPSVSRVLLPLGVGEHFARWGYPEEKLAELDWRESIDLGDGFTLHCLPARHFSGRGLRRNQTLWASFLLETPAGRRIYLGGDSGYGPHFREIGAAFPHIDLAILENGQYNPDWAQIHTLPEELPLVCRDLGAKEIITVHHSKYTLSQHPWDEPRRNEDALEKEGFSIRRLVMGRPEILWTP